MRFSSSARSGSRRAARTMLRIACLMRRERLEAGEQHVEEPLARRLRRERRIDAGKHALVDLPDEVGEHREPPVIAFAQRGKRDAGALGDRRRASPLERPLGGERHQRFDDLLAGLWSRQGHSSGANQTPAPSRSGQARSVAMLHYISKDISCDAS